jgi:nitrogen fixation-related uncharacterized protein
MKKAGCFEDLDEEAESMLLADLAGRSERIKLL